MTTELELFSTDLLLAEPDAFSDRDYQVEAVHRVYEGLADGGRGQLWMACGTGKTKVSVWAAQRLCPSHGIVVVLCPSLALVNQILKEWNTENTGHVALAVCSEITLKYDTSARVSDITLAEVTTNPAEIASWLRRQRTASTRLIIATYHSAEAAGEGLLRAGTAADLLVVDEAHHTAGREGKQWAKIHKDEVLPAHRRLFTTATPRLVTAKPSKTDGSMVDVVSMDDESVFGPTLFRYSFATAIKDGWLDDYRVAVICVTSQEVLELLRHTSGDLTLDGSNTDVRTAMIQAAIARAAREYDLRRVLAFCPRIADSKNFIKTFPATLDRLPANGKPQARLSVDHIDGSMDFDLRMAILNDLAHAQTDEWVVVSNVKCLAEGIDVPALDGVALTSKKKSMIEIIQIVSRALRRNPHGTGTSTVIVPVLMPDDATEDDTADAFTDEGYQTLWHVVQALRAHDDDLGVELDQARMTGEFSGTLRKRIEFSMPEQFCDGDFLEHLTVRIVECSTLPWWDGVRHARAFRTKYGHLHVPYDYVNEEDFLLGAWISRSRTRTRRDTLLPEQVATLDELGMVWNAVEARWWAMVDVCARYKAEFGDLAPHGLWVIPEKWGRFAGARLYPWLARQIQSREQGKLTGEQIAALDAHGMVWQLRVDLQYTTWLGQAKEFFQEFGHLRPPSSGRWTELAIWVSKRVKEYQDGRLAPDRIRDLERLGINWRPVPLKQLRWNECLAVAVAYKKKHGNFYVPKSVGKIDGVDLRKWLEHQSILFRKGDLSAEREQALLDIGYELGFRKLTGKPYRERVIVNFRDALGEFGSVDKVPRGYHMSCGYTFHVMWGRVRREHRLGTLHPEIFNGLTALGLEFALAKDGRPASPLPQVERQKTQTQMASNAHHVTWSDI